MTATACGYAQLTVSTSALTLNAAATTYASGGFPGSTKVQPNAALITCSTNNVRWTDDGTPPTASVGIPLLAGQSLTYEGDPGKLRFIRSGSADATLDIVFERAD